MDEVEEVKILLSIKKTQLPLTLMNIQFLSVIIGEYQRPFRESSLWHEKHGCYLETIWNPGVPGP